MRFLLALLALAFSLTSTAQPTWRFHLAFEDGTGARDTIWFVYDTTATTGSDFNPQVDDHLGEGAVEMDLDVFNVFVWNWQWDSTKTKAWPYSWFPYGHMVIEAFNYTAPVIIRWDTALFNSPVLPITPDTYIGFAELMSDYFWLTGQVTAWGFGMLDADSVVVDDPALMFGQLIMAFDQHSGLGIMESFPSMPMRLYPNPADEQVTLSVTKIVELVKVYDARGNLIYADSPKRISPELDISQWPLGAYMIQAFTSNTTHHAKLIKVDTAW